MSDTDPRQLSEKQLKFWREMAGSIGGGIVPRLLDHADYMDEQAESQAALVTALERKSRGVGHDWLGLMEQRDKADGLVAQLMKALRKAQEDVCSLRCRSTWLTESRPPHGYECRIITELLSQATGTKKEHNE